MGKLKTNEEFINDCKLIYGDKYDYSLVKYVNNKTKIKIICSIHGEFEQTPDKHLNSKSGCKKCMNCSIKKNDNNRNTLIDRLRQKHNNFYDYSLVNYINSKTKIKIICPEHGEFEQIANNHLSGYGCPTCGGTKKFSDADFIKKSIEIHGDKYDYSSVKYVNYSGKVKIICPIHGEFKQSFIKHCNRKNGCPICKESKGEKQIRLYLVKYDINFIQQYRFINCVNKRMLPFDFYLPDLNVCIEYNGIQHYKPVTYYGGDDKFKQQIINDNIKYSYCNDNEIEFLVIKYDEDIVKSLTKKIKNEK